MKKVFNLFVAAMAVMVMASCGEKKQGLEVLAGEWDVVSVGDLVVPDSVGAFLGFDLAEHMVYGSAGCNQLAGAMPQEVDGEQLLFASLGSTQRMCPDMTVEDALLPALGSVVGFRVEADALHLLGADGDVVVLLSRR